MIYEEGKEQLYPVSWEVFTENFILSKADINTIDAQGHMDSRLKHIYYAQVEGQYPLLANGVRLVDTPGLGVSISRPIATPGFLKRSDAAIIVVLNAVKPFPKDTQTFLSTVVGSKRRDNVFFVINRIDQLPLERIELLKKEVRQTLRQHFIGENYAFDGDLYSRRVFFTSAKQALEAGISLPPESTKLDASGLPALERELEQFLTGEERFSKTIEPTLQTLKYVAEKAYQQIAQGKATLAASGKSKKSLPVVKERMRLDTIEKKVTELVEKANRIAFRSQVPLMQGTSQLLMEKSGPLEAWIDIDDLDIDDHLHFVEQFIERPNIPASLRSEAYERINEIFYRRTDPNLYMAVVGEFSSGKSTFINALLRQELLKTSVLVTTAASTRIRYGPSPNVEVLFKKQKEPLSYLKDSIRLWQLIRFFNRQGKEKVGEVGDLRECIHFLSAIDGVATHIDHLVISHPAPFLSDGIVIVDTPGTNADHEEHAQITFKLIEQEADAAVIIIPAPFPLAMTLTDFLTHQLRPFLHRCLFVVTQMDKIPEAEHEKLLDNIRTRLAKALNIEQPAVLYQSAPKVVLDTLNEQKVVPMDIQRWNDQFIELEDTLWNRLRHERTLSIAERVLRLLNSLFEQLDKHLREHDFGDRLAIQSDLNEIDRRCEALREKQKQLATIVISST
jgi:GTP-binding protein EngB required for normal cell division